MTPDLVLFFALAVVAIVSAIAMIASRNAVYSALFLVLNFITIATIYLLLNAAFIAMVQVTVYAGAIMVLFLFVIMLLGSEREERTSAMPWQAPTAFVFSIALLIIIAGALLLQELVPNRSARSDGAQPDRLLGDDRGVSEVSRVVFLVLRDRRSCDETHRHGSQ